MRRSRTPFTDLAILFQLLVWAASGAFWLWIAWLITSWI